MTRLIKRAWRYLEAALERRLEQAADPRLQIEQAIEEAKRQHALLTQAAASVVGNERELDIKLNRALDSIERLKASIAQLAPASDVPTLDEVQAKLDQRYANAMGTAEIAAASIETRLLEVDASVIEQQGLRRLEEIRQSIKLDEP